MESKYASALPACKWPERDLNAMVCGSPKRRRRLSRTGPTLIVPSRPRKECGNIDLDAVIQLVPSRNEGVRFSRQENLYGACPAAQFGIISCGRPDQHVSGLAGSQKNRRRRAAREKIVVTIGTDGGRQTLIVRAAKNQPRNTAKGAIGWGVVEKFDTFRPVGHSHAGIGNTHFYLRLAAGRRAGNLLGIGGNNQSKQRQETPLRVRQQTASLPGNNR